MTDAHAVLVSLIFGVGGLAQGILFRLGYSRRLGEWYFYRDLPFFIRNLGFFLIPGGAAILTFSVIIAIGRSGADQQGAGAFALMMCFVFFVVGIMFAWRPPNWLKPDWLRDRESRTRKGHT